jgi:hypothetical protein
MGFLFQKALQGNPEKEIEHLERFQKDTFFIPGITYRLMAIHFYASLTVSRVACSLVP